MKHKVSGLSELRHIYHGDWQASVDAHGAQVLALNHKDENLLHFDPEDIGHSGIPLCLPHFGPLNDGQFSHHGQDFPMGQHGFIRNRNLKAVAVSDHALTYEFCADEDSKQKFPFDFRLRVTHTLTETGLCIKLNIENQSDEPMPLAPGVHPYFKVEDNSDIRFTTQADSGNHNPDAYREKALEDSGFFKILHREGNRKTVRVQRNPDMHLIDHGLATTELQLKGQPKLEIHADNKVFKRMTIWRSSEQAPFICVEPASCKNALNDSPILIAAGQSFETEVKIGFSA